MDWLEEYSVALFALEKEYERSLKNIAKGYAEAFDAEGYELVSGTVAVLRGSSHYRAAKDVVSGDVLRCELDPRNEVDPLAIRVHDWERCTVGHIAADSEIREKVREVLDAGENVYAVVVHTTMPDRYGKIKVIFAKRA